MQDPRYPRYRPNITLKDLVDTIKSTGHLHAHVGPMTLEQVRDKANEEQPGPPPMGDKILGAHVKKKVKKKKEKKAKKAAKKKGKDNKVEPTPKKKAQNLKSNDSGVTESMELL